MGVIQIVLLSLSAIALGFFLYEKCKGYSLKAVFIKAVASMLFISLAAVNLFKTGYHIFPKFALIALALGMLGDVALDLKYVYKENDKPYTIAGFTVFGIGHILYITGMFLEFYHGESFLYILLPFVVGLLGGVITVLIEKPMKLQYKEFRWIVGVYATILFSMMATTISLTILSGFQAVSLILLMAGGILFALSDLILNMTYFGEGHEKPFDIISNTITYYIAQNLIALSILFL